MHPAPLSIEELLRQAPAAAEETERFVTAAYADRRDAPMPLRSMTQIVDTDVASYIFNWHSSAQRHVDALRDYRSSGISTSA